MLFELSQIYGIRCHLLHRFGISEKDWFRIKQNMDSKCRTVWRRKLKGLPIGTNRVSIMPKMPISR